MRVAILGCGYVGLELGRQLRDVHDVIGVRRSDAGVAAVEDAGLTAVQADVTDPTALSAVPDADALVFAASSGGRGPEAARAVYVEGLQTVIDTFGARTEPPERLVYASSTGVYGDHGGEWVDEATPLDPQTEKTRVLARAERVAREQAAETGIDGTVVRLAGLYGPDRYRLERYLEGPVTEGYLNVIHRADAAGAIRHLLTENLARDEVVLAVDDEPVSKWAFADWLAAACDRPEPPKQTKAQRLAADDLSTAAQRRIQTSKRCSNEKLHGLGYEFDYPTYREGYQDAVDTYRRTA
ncbi:MAG: SDR family oxidoreductase [Haloarculaceae archaeon]